jgi:sugar lactone lactonase YvrE
MFAFTVLAAWTTFPVVSAHNNGIDFIANSTAEIDSVRQISLSTNDVIYNPTDNSFYASVPSSAVNGGNSLTRINPLSGSVISSVFVGSEPSHLALSGDGQSLYVMLDGAFSVRRYDTLTQTPGQQFFIGRDPNTVNYRASDIAVAPDNPNILAVARTRPGFSPSEYGVAVFENGVQRPQTGPTLSEGSSSLAFAASGSTLYGTGTFSGLKTMAIGGDGVTVTNSSTLGSGSRIQYDNGLIVSSAGQVIDASSSSLLGTFANAASNAFVSDKSVGRAYYLVRDSVPNTWILKAYDINNFNLIGTLTISGVAGDADALRRWGTNGLAFRTTANQVFFVQTSLIPTPNPLPTPTDTPMPTPTPVVTPVAVFSRQLTLPANDMVYDSVTQRLYASVGSGGGAYGNSVTTINPQAGAVENSVFIGSEPNRLAAANDGQTLYVALGGSLKIRKFNIPTLAAGAQFSIGSDNTSGPYWLSDIAVAPDNPDLVAVSRMYRINPSFAGVAVFENGVQRPQTTPGQLGGFPVIGFGATGATLYGGNYSPGLSIMNVSSGGVAVSGGYPFFAGNRLKYSNGLVYGSKGQVIDPATGLILGTFQVPSSSSDTLVAPDPVNGRVFFLAKINSVWQIQSFDINTFLPLGAVNLSSVGDYPKAFTRWGVNGFAFIDGNRIHLIQTSLVNPSETVPEPTPTPTPTPTPLPPTPPATFLRRVELPINDLVYNEPNGSIYASIPSSASAGRGNSITKINPETGAIDSSVFVGSEPDMMALADDGETLYVKLNGASAIRRFNAATQTPGPQFTVNNFSYVRDMTVLPGKPQSLVLAQYIDGVAVYDNGIRRPNMTTGGAVSISHVESGASDSTVYGMSNESTFGDLVKFGVDASGVSGISRAGNITGGFGNDIRFSGGLLYTQYGAVIDPETQTFVGSFPDANSTFTIDPLLHRAFYMNRNVLTSYDTDTFLKVGSVTLPSFTGVAASLVRWGVNGLAFRVFASSNPADNQLYIIQSALVSPNGTVPTGLQVSASAYTVPEHAGSLTVSVIRTGDLSAETSVSYATADGTATGGADYGTTVGTLSFAPGESSKNIAVPIIDDNIFEGTETFNLILSNPEGGELLSPSSSVITLTDNDPVPAISTDGLTIDEPPPIGAAHAVFQVRLSNPTTQTVTVKYATANGSAIAGSDYVSASGTLTFSPLETSKSVDVVINGDGFNELFETFFMTLSNSTNASISTAQVTALIRNYNASRRAKFDFDADNKTDLSIFRSGVSEWWYLRSSTGEPVALRFGLDSDRLTPGDFTGDGKTDIAIWRPDSGEWFVLRSEDNSYFSFPFGTSGDVPCPADYDGDGRADAAVFRPSESTWYISRSSDFGTLIIQFGNSGDKPVAADYDGDGKADIAIFRPSDGSWWYVQSSNAQFKVYRFGVSTDKPVQGDYTGDGKADIAVFRPSTGEWYFQRSEDNSYFSVPFGAAGDIPAPGDYDGDDRFDTAVFRPSNGDWYIQRSSAGILITNFGASGDRPIPNSFVP